ncbi:V/A-type H+-transporting ATPase subunit I [Deinobacterium chartae]|uniref:V/A-type H+-transporting ATPase subunit I n=2 Tax=Deinobacterium chartae TaxID=521158 RepID=A0A841I1S6_9DEIO|nr:V/A-type H+-transporting ATPase subunit I [Deinobacterium chartae]
MKQVLLVGRKRDAQRLMTALQGAGVLHIDPLRSDELKGEAFTAQEAEQRRQLEQLLARAESAIQELRLGETVQVPVPAEDQWETRLEVIASRANRLIARRNDLQSELELARAYADTVRVVGRLAAGLDRSPRFAVLPFTAPAEDLSRLRAALTEALGERYAFEAAPAGGNQAGVVAVLRSDRDTARAALVRGGAGELRLPGRFEGMSLEEAASALNAVLTGASAELEGIERELYQVRSQLGPELRALRDAIADRVALFQARDMAASGQYGLALQGYVPADRLLELENALRPFADDVVFEVRDASDDHHHAAQVPVTLRNKGYFKRMELLLGMFPPPKYGTFDPTPIIGAFFPFFFGFIIADIAYGLLLLWLGITFANMARANKPLIIGFMGFNIAPPALSDLGYIIKWMAGWSILWGFLTGEFFGTFLEHLHVFYINDGEHSGLIPILFPRLETEFVNTVLVISLAFGIIQVLWGWFIRVQLTMKHNETKHMWEAIGMLGGLIGLILMSITFLQAGGFGALADVSNPVNWAMYVAFAVFLLGVVLSGVPMMLMEIISNGGNLLSYSRLFAVGLASAVLAKLASDAGWSLYEQLGIIGAVLGLIVGLLIHVLAVAFTIIGHVLQPLRLNYVEFLTKTGFYDESGRRYTPFRRLSAVETK